MIAEVIVDIAHSEVDKIFDYSFSGELNLGCRVKAPFANTVVDGFVVGIKDTTTCPPEKLKSISYIYDEKPALTKESLFLIDKISDRYKVCKALAMRLFLPSEMRKGTVKDKLTYFVEAKSISVNDFAKLEKTKAQKKLYTFLLQNGKTEKAEVLKEYSSAILKALIDKNYVEVTSQKNYREPLKQENQSYTEKNLTDEQINAIESIEKSQKTTQLIFGVTGSGKTEIYLNLIEKCLSQNKSAIFLVPEISLTPQMFLQLKARFKNNVAILHSGLSVGERYDEWTRLRLGEAKIAVGARSAIFAPVQNLGVIVIDEEHDSSYISETAPRYDTTFIAETRAKYNNCKLILGSATPSVTTFLKAKENEYNLITLSKRINKKPMPEITIADMKNELKNGNNSAFSGILKQKLTECLNSNNQAIIFLNRRGYAQHIICQECGYIAKCKNCDVSLTYHSEDNCLKCHYCGAKYQMLTSCPECGSVHVRYAGTGTQKVVYELEKLYPNAKILRMDNDTTSGKEGHYKILKAFAEKRADILVGTQMIAKGHDFPSVTLAGILDADMSLQFADYRSGERTFQLITQVAGRSGRADEKGSVVLQTFSPENAILNYAVKYDYNGFFKYETNLRKMMSFPPYSTIARVMLVGEDEKTVIQTLKSVYFALEELYKQNKEEFLFFNKMKSPIKKIQKKYRYQTLMRLKTNKLLDKIYQIAEKNKNKNVMVYVEENPSSLS